MGIDRLAARRVIALGAMLASPRAGKGHGKFDFIEILKIGIVHDPLFYDNFLGLSIKPAR